MREYPHPSQIRKVKTWAFDKPGSFTEFMDYVQSIGNYWPTGGFGWRRQGRTYWVSTGGWSGNEDIISAMQENFIFWSVCWYQSKRGGHYTFTLPDERTYFKDGL